MEFFRFFCLTTIGICALLLPDSLCAFGSDLSNMKRDSLIIAQGDTLQLERSLKRYDHIVVKGILLIKPKREIEIVARNITIDGGLIKAIVDHQQSASKIKFILGKSAKPSDHFFEVKNKGRVHLEVTNLPEIPASVSTLRNYTHHSRISFKPAMEASGGLIIEASAGAIFFKGIEFKDLGNASQNIHAIDFKNKGDQHRIIEQCVITGSKGDALYIEGAATIKKSLFLKNLQTDLHIVENNSAHKSLIQDNTFFSEEKPFSNKPVYSVKISTYQLQFSGNQMYIGKGKSGVYTGGKKNHSDDYDTNFVFENNRLESLSDSSDAVGLFVADSEEKRKRTLAKTFISNFSTGIVVKGKGVSLDSFSIHNAITGMITSDVYAKNIEIVRDSTKEKGSNTQAIWLKSSNQQHIKPVFENIIVSNYAMGFKIDASLEEEHYFKDIQYYEVTEKLRITQKFTNASYLKDMDGTLLGVITNSGQTKQAQKHLLQVMSSSAHSTQLVFGTNSFYNTNQNTNNTQFVSELDTKFGDLTFSTGTGMDDPVHEHERGFRTIVIENVSTERVLFKELHTNRQKFLLPAFQTYEIGFELEDPIYDIGLEWEALPEHWILVSFDYPHEMVYGLRSFGKLLPESNSLRALEQSNFTNYFYDPNLKKVYLKIYNTENHDEAVIYSAKITTEIRLSQKPVALEMKTDKRSRQVFLEYQVPANTPSRLILTDSYGNTMKVLVNDQKGKHSQHKGVIDLMEFDLNKDVYLYFLQIGDQVQKGPVYEVSPKS